MLVESIKCFECGGDSSVGEHVDGCTSIWLMNLYCDFVENLDRYPDHLVTKLSNSVYFEILSRQSVKRKVEFQEEV